MNQLASETGIALRWLTKEAAMPVGVTWGIPWREGELQREEPLRLNSLDGNQAIPLQSWPTAFWPDGSVKWSAHAAANLQGAADGYSVDKGKGPASEHRVVVTETDDTITLNTGIVICTLGKRGQLLRSITRHGAEICSGGDLICLKENVSDVSGIRTVREEAFESRIYQAVIEQQGPVRAVVKLDGRQRAMEGTREWLPFSLRLYVYAGMDSIRLVHTFHYDGNPHEDSLQGLGIRFIVPMRGAHYNRHVRFAGDRGCFSESPKTLHTRRTKGKYRELFERQTRGEAVSFDAQEDAYFLGLLDDSATWGSFKLVQDSSEHYRLWKRTQAGCSWVKIADGRRAGGLGYVGGEGGGLAAGLRNFWQKHPSGFEVHGTAETEAAFTVWFWSPDGGPMDLRHYDTQTHVESSYEGAEELRATPYGIANTSEMTLWCTKETPDDDLLRCMQEQSQSPSLLVCEPAYYHRSRAFGYWSLPDRSSAIKQQLENRLDGIITFYQEETEQRKWYGFWDYGDYMHSYDPVRHVWNYDLGGCAWQNTELAPNMWLWTQFLRTGRADIFRMAEAMTRHTSEVDVYHFGEYAGLGSRHNVVHWGCGCKEARIAMAGLHRYYYYLTVDERLGDMMNEVRDSDYTTVNIDPMRAYFPKDEHPTHVRVGPDWAAFSSNWMTRWERFEDTAYRDKILVGIASIKRAKYRLISGPTYGYDPKTGVLSPMGDDNWGRHLAISMGAPQVWFELAAMLKDQEWEDMLAEFGVYYNLSQEDKDKLTNGSINTNHFEHPVLSAAIAAYGAYYRKDEETARTCWSILLANPFALVDLQKEAALVTHIDTLKEIDWINTNEAAQWSLNTMIALEFIADFLPEP
ncbi:exo-rhamnogalacturonan lyase family protein [Paenibacillus alba]|uniref:exo-rhamnogalacturonan lyase family protein n=1 Tax=Paenibacillus alba TaxID=1197127 RepID=UPI00398B8A21